MASNSSANRRFSCRNPYCNHRCGVNDPNYGRTHLCCSILPRRLDGGNVVIARPGPILTGPNVLPITRPHELVTYHCELCGRSICGLPGPPYMGGACKSCGHIYCYQCSFS